MRARRREGVQVSEEQEQGIRSKAGGRQGERKFQDNHMVASKHGIHVIVVVDVGKQK